MYGKDFGDEQIPSRYDIFRFILFFNSRILMCTFDYEFAELEVDIEGISY